MKSSFSSFPHHQNFEELAALAAVGELSALELERLHGHLAECPRCREAYEAFLNVASNDLGVVAADRESLQVEHVSLAEGDEGEAREHLKRLRTRLKTDDALSHGQSRLLEIRGRTAGGGRNHKGRQFAVYGIAATLLVTASVGAAMALWRSARMLSAERAHARELQAQVNSLKTQTSTVGSAEGAVVRSLKESQSARDALQKSLRNSESENQELLARERASEDKLAAAIAASEELRQRLDAANGDKETLAKLQRDSDAKLHQALVELYNLRNPPVETVVKAAVPDDGALPADGEKAAVEVASGSASPSEVEARNLFGARDLHIVDVYDVKGDGKTKRTYGRVYYVEKKLLVFYAFDLQNRQNHKRGVFQAWGYREANVGKPLNLGLFAIDDNAVGRWVLTVNRPDVLSHIDAVFVTAEPSGGSDSPRGKKVLYANLVGPPNHP